MSNPSTPVELSYESAAPEPAGPRPKWVWVVIVLYLLVAAFIVLLPLWALFGDSDSGLIAAASITACVFALCSVGLMFASVRRGRRRVVNRASICIPIIASGICVSALIVGLALALMELIHKDDNWALPIMIGGGAVWVPWSILLWFMTQARSPDTVAIWLNRTIFGGSVAELLVAVPCHVIVRRRDECCAGIYTGMGICLGCLVLLASLGPGVVFLYYRRWKQISRE